MPGSGIRSVEDPLLDDGQIADSEVWRSAGWHLRPETAHRGLRAVEQGQAVQLLGEARQARGLEIARAAQHQRQRDRLADLLLKIGSNHAQDRVGLT